MLVDGCRNGNRNVRIFQEDPTHYENDQDDGQDDSKETESHQEPSEKRLIVIGIVEEHGKRQQYGDHDEDHNVNDVPEQFHIDSSRIRVDLIIGYVERKEQWLRPEQDEAQHDENLTIDSCPPSLVIG